ncbi:hypothetical protein H6G89_10055 [Oscillatoria sp. FACHB-1407]|uniref:hypothetical protein n=1 Tax=Oscillatoria sp. FACHB-1407 TaxID=2692847 RepID=UPI0016835FDD|nr:hypothetical protein [Oscillatoria sp. FACHB-1407]MBD2461390.1 hypothetical protein [Oscillatoria sp. FACHB-1407]
MSNVLTQRIRQHQNLAALRNKLLKLHQVLLDIERNTYEQAQGRVSRGELLQLVINHEQFAWLHRISELIVQIDDLLRADEPVLPDEVQTLMDNVRSLLSPSLSNDEFADKYDAALQREPNAILAHADVIHLLTEMA